MKILVISMIREPWGGSEELWASMAEYGLSLGHEIIHSTFNFPEPATKEKQLIDKGLIHYRRRGWISPGTVFFSRIIQKIHNYVLNNLSNPFLAVFKIKPDYVLYNGTCYSIMHEKYLLPVLLKSKIPFGIIAHYNQENGEDLRGISLNNLKNVFESASAVFFVSKRTLLTAEKYINEKIDNAIIVRNPVNMSSAEPVLYPKNHTACFAMVGNLRIVHKGQDIALSVLGSKTWKERDWHLNIFGSGEDEILIKKLAADYDLENRITFHGKVADIRKIWKENQLLLMPSRMEGMPLAVVEAMICGRPAVVTDVGGHTEWIEEGKEGWIASEAGVPSFEKAMENAWMQREKWEEIGKAAHEKAIILYDPGPGKTLLSYITKTVEH